MKTTFKAFLAEAYRSKDFILDFDITELDFHDIMNALENNGFLTREEERKKFYPQVSYGGLAQQAQNVDRHFYFVARVDEEIVYGHVNDISKYRYDVSKVFLSLDRNGKISAYFEAQPDHEGWTIDQVKGLIK